jgi:hypothetical protein
MTPSNLRLKILKADYCHMKYLDILAERIITLNLN